MPGEELRGEKKQSVLIRPQFLRFLALGGDEEAPVHAAGISLQGALIDPDNPTEPALDLRFCECPVPLRFLGCRFNGSIDARSSQLKQLELVSCIVDANSPAGDAIDLSYSKIASNLTFRGTVLIGINYLFQARIGGLLDFRDGNFFSNKECHEKYLEDGMEPIFNYYMKSVEKGITLNCINADGIIVEGSAFLGAGEQRENDNALYVGTLRMVGAQISGDVSLDGGIFLGLPVSLDLDKAKIGRSLRVVSIKQFIGSLDLSGCEAGSLVDDKESWDKINTTVLSGFTYETVNADLTDRGIQWWKEWLSKQMQKHRTTDLKTQPFEQLAKVLRELGHEPDARKILHHKRRQMRRTRRDFPESYGGPARGEFNLRWWATRKFEWFLEKGVGYGYKPQNAAIALFAISLFMWLVYWDAAYRGVMTPTHPLVFQSGSLPQVCRDNWAKFTSPGIGGKPECMKAMPPEYSPFNPFMYSLDVGIPLVEFGQEADWSPRATKPPNGESDFAGSVVRFLMYLQILSGWILSLLFVSAVSGVIRRE